MSAREPGTDKLGRRMGLLATLAFLVLGWSVFDGLIARRHDPNHDLQVSADSSELRLQRNRAGHYLAHGYINGQPVRLLVDTGATHTAIPAELADRLGLQAGAATLVSTANGNAQVFNTRLDELLLGPFRFRNVPAQLHPGMGGSDILLGMSVLKTVDFAQRGDQLVLRPAQHSARGAAQ